MARFVVTNLVIAGVLLCPYRCWGGLGSCAVAQGTTESSCCACPSRECPERSHGGQRPVTPERDDDECFQCVCIGVLLANDAGPSRELRGASFEPAAWGSMPVREASGNHDAPQADATHGSAPSGRMLRARLQSFLL